MQDADAEDVTQNILVKLSHKLRAFAYDPSRSFRGWLKTVAHHAWRDFEDGRRRARPTAGDSDARELILTLEAREDLVQKLEEAFDLELLEAAKAAGPPAGRSAYLGGVPPDRRWKACRSPK